MNRRTDMTAHADRSSSAGLTQASPTFAKRTVFCADDEPAILRLYGDALRSVGYNVETYHNGAEALEAARHRPFDLLITDYDMPRMKGLELARQIRAEGLRQPIILASAKLLPLLEENLSSIRFASILIKPFPIADLIAAVDRTMSYRKSSAAPADLTESTAENLFHIARHQSHA